VPVRRLEAKAAAGAPAEAATAAAVDPEAMLSGLRDLAAALQLPVEGVPSRVYRRRC
jgi:hypothetical protein